MSGDIWVFFLGGALLMGYRDNQKQHIRYLQQVLVLEQHDRAGGGLHSFTEHGGVGCCWKKAPGVFLFCKPRVWMFVL